MHNKSSPLQKLAVDCIILLPDVDYLQWIRP